MATALAPAPTFWQIGRVLKQAKPCAHRFRETLKGSCLSVKLALQTLL